MKIDLKIVKRYIMRPLVVLRRFAGVFFVIVLSPFVLIFASIMAVGAFLLLFVIGGCWIAGFLVGIWPRSGPP